MGDRYRTSDHNYAAYLRIMGCQFMECVKAEGRVYFMFNPSPDMRGHKRDYFTHKGNVPARQYADEIKTMKALIHETMNESLP